MIILIGKSASGKTYIGKCLEKIGFKKNVTYTSREKRIGEIEGKDYYFLTKDEFLNKIKEGFFFEYVIYNNNYYGTSINSLKELKSYLIVEPNGFYKYKDLDNIVSFYVECSETTLITRMKKRGDKLEDIKTRITNDALIFNDSIKNDVDYVINGENNIDIIIKEIEDKYNGCLKKRRNNK